MASRRVRITAPGAFSTGRSQWLRNRRIAASVGPARSESPMALKTRS